ncbi:peroxidase 72-like [Silene latifolia]|uniref:peroxidase 72-like n=1 Tax=Silene latifolia TaxID=37657 RepID=UPI003D773BB0
MCNNAMKKYTIFVSLLAIVPLCFVSKAYGQLSPGFYDITCPIVQAIVRSTVINAINQEPRMAASLLRLHFLDCFVQGCDASLLLDSSGSIISEKGSNANKNSARGFDVIDRIKHQVERICPGVVSCADILALAARDSTLIAGGPSWTVDLGRRDSLKSSLSGSNDNIPGPNTTFETILSKFTSQGLTMVDLVALSGAHTIGKARCTSFRQRLYNQNGGGKPDATIDPSYGLMLRGQCPPSGGDQNLFNLDPATPDQFDNIYYKNLVLSRGLLNSDQILFTNQASRKLVEQYAGNKRLFFDQFVISMVKMGNLFPLTGADGEIRESCRSVNAPLVSLETVLT